MSFYSKYKIWIWILLILTGLGVFAFLCFLVAMYLLLGHNTSYTYAPKFKNSNFEVVHGDGFATPHIYYQTDQKLSVGQELSDLKFLVVSKESGTDDPTQFRMHYFDTVVDEVYKGYVVFKIKNTIFDCFGIYFNNRLIQYDHIERGFLPTPSDRWMCDGFDFKQNLRD